MATFFSYNLAMNRSPKTVSLFAGGGGLDLGFSASGFSIVYSTDIDPYSVKTLMQNQRRKEWYGQHPVGVEDVRKITRETLTHSVGLDLSEIDFVIGGPPCQSFSVFGKRRGVNDPRGNLIWEYVRIVDLIRPIGFLFENVAGLKTIHGGQVFAELQEALSFGGAYKISVHTYQVAEHGIPQYRERVIIIGNRIGKDISGLPKTHSEPSKGLASFRTVKEALGGLPKPGADCGRNCHVGRKHSKRIVERYKDLQFGERDPKTRINKLNPNKPSHAIIVGSDKGGGKGHVHPYDPREVTPRESARIQTFPDWWEFNGTGRHVIRQVGNAVPPLFAAQIAAHIKKNLFGYDGNSGYKSTIKKIGLDYLK